MNSREILTHLDTLFAKQDLQAVEPYLSAQLEKAYECQDYSTCITIMNEMIGFFRDTSQYQKSLDYSEQVLALMQQLGYEDTLPYATTALNVANALRAAGYHQESLNFYEKVFQIYQQTLEPYDERIASFYNNLSLLYQEMDNFENAVACLRQALEIVSKGNDVIKIAITHTNLGASLLQLGQNEYAVEHLKKALSIFHQTEEKDFHYNAALAAMGQAFVSMGKLEDARNCYLEALQEQMKHCGKSEAFYRILENLHIVEQALELPLTKEPENIHQLENQNTTALKFTSGLDLSQAFYENIAKPSLFTAFPEYVNRMAIGLVGEGSECFGFDDELSKDHDFGPGFCIWLSRDDFHAIGNELQLWYDSLPNTYMGYPRKNTSYEMQRVGVFCVDDFFEQILGYSDITQISNERIALQIPDEAWSTIFNGRMFHDPSGIFSQRRLAFYEMFTEKMWQQKMANSLILLGKYGQYNYPRSMKRGDYVTAQMILYKYIEELLKFIHYSNHVFPPYYKWLKKSASGLTKLAVLADLTDALADFADGRKAWEDNNSGASDKVVGTIEIIAQLIINECRNDGMFNGFSLSQEELFLEAYGKEWILKLSKPSRKLTPLTDEQNLENNSHEELVDYLVSLEWQAFDAVQNQGGRADCQDDWGTFSIMRKSQYLIWTKELLISLIRDFREANATKRNLITEKYGRMMKTTDPAAYAKISDKLPKLTPLQETIIEEIVKIQVSCMEDFAKKYPYMASNSRTIHTADDQPFDTSYETYLRGELSTYSPETLKLYGNFIVELVKNEKNPAQMIMENTALLYGYQSLEDAERQLAN